MKTDSKNHGVWKQYAERQEDSNDLMDLYFNPIVDLGKALWKRIAGDATDDADDCNQDSPTDSDTIYGRAVDQTRPIDESDCNDFLDEAFFVLQKAGFECECHKECIIFKVEQISYWLLVRPCYWNRNELFEVELRLYFKEEMTPSNLRCANETNNHTKALTALGDDFIVFVTRGQMADCDHLLDFVEDSIEDIDYSARYFYTVRDASHADVPTKKVGLEIQPRSGK